MSYDGLLLDHDGVLVRLLDINQLSAAAERALADAGIESPDKEAIETLTISVSHDAHLALSERLGVDPEQLWHYRDKRVAEVLRDGAKNGTKEPYDDITVLGRVDRPMGIASNNQTELVEHIMSIHGLSDLFGTIRARDPVLSSLEVKKPSPTYLEEAMEDMGVDRPLYVGDSQSDIVAGNRAGVDTAFIRRDHNADVDPNPKPTYDVAGLNEVVEILEGK